jgi:SAM-dependent methyltransferase
VSLNAFTDQAARPGLYDQGGQDGRLGRRTTALHRAKIEGNDVAELIATAIGEKTRVSPASVIADIGCGRGSTTLALARHFPDTFIVGVDASAAMLADARHKIATAGGRTAFAVADFHDLPFTGASVEAAVAAFCLYHSPHPADAIGEITRALTPGGLAVLVTKSADSYRELDEVLACIDPAATDRPSLYASAHSGNLAALASSHLDVVETWNEQHRFRFHDLAHVAQYAITSPKYRRAGGLQDADDLTAELRRRTADQAVIATSTVSYVIGRSR